MMTREEMITSLESMFNYLRDNGPDEFQDFFDSLEPEYQALLTDLFKDFVKISVNSMSPKEREDFDRQLLAHLPHLGKTIN
jgi:hypothetical protein